MSRLPAAARNRADSSSRNPRIPSPRRRCSRATRSTPRDCATVVAGIRLARRLAATRALGPYVAGEYLPGQEAETDDEVLVFARNKGATICPPCRHVGDVTSRGCARGRRRRAALRDGIAGLCVVDLQGLVMPTLVSGKINAPVIMIAGEGQRGHDPERGALDAARFPDSTNVAPAHVSPPEVPCPAATPISCHRGRQRRRLHRRDADVTFGADVLAEAGNFHARELGNDARRAVHRPEGDASDYAATVKASLAAGWCRFRRVSRRRHRADRPVAAGRGAIRRGGAVRRLRVGRRRIGDGHVQGGEPVRDAAGRLHGVRERADRRGAQGSRRGAARTSPARRRRAPVPRRPASRSSTCAR